MSAHKLFVPVEPDQVGVVPYRIRDGAVEFLLITSRKSRRWLIPKGNVEPEMGPRESARMEASEEAGISGELGPEPLGCYRHGRSKSSSVVEVFLLRVDGEEDSWLEAHERKRRW
ncbi:MAG: NUDIX hydrolase, partial [Gemmatimonadota bacterium]|nr:NUDIX hydrolase [Gemmatimonadota bacterium]